MAVPQELEQPERILVPYKYRLGVGDQVRFYILFPLSLRSPPSPRGGGWVLWGGDQVGVAVEPHPEIRPI
jgi:hypothetical protein